MENPKNELSNKLKDANNVLVTVSANPSVDQLSAAIGLTLFLSKLKKHATTVFSGEVPSTIEFLKPEETIEDNTDSLRDFIIALDKSKADKIRYKVEDTMVKIFITPYRTSIGENDLEFSQGDFNVDVVVGIGVHNKDDLDQALTSHGRILHDATVATLNTKDGSELGHLNWVDGQASSLCEMVVSLTDLLKANSLDAQIATALLTGIVAETERFSNSKTSSTTMNASAKLMAAGANQQLVATKLEGTLPEGPTESSKPSSSSDDEGGGHVGGGNHSDTSDDDGALRIDHNEENTDQAEPEQPPPPAPEPPMPPQQNVPLPPPVANEEPPIKDMFDDYSFPSPPPPPPQIDQIHIDHNGQLGPQPPQEPPHIVQEHRAIVDHPPESQRIEDSHDGSVNTIGQSAPHESGIVNQPPQFGGQLTAASTNLDQDSSSGSMSLPPVGMLSHNSGAPNDVQGINLDEDNGEQPLRPPWPEAATIVNPTPPPPPPNLVKAAEPPKTNQSSASTTPKPKPKPETPKAPPPEPLTHLRYPHPEPKPKPEPKETLPHSVISVMDDHTLKDIEKAVDSPHRKQVEEDLKQKTLEEVEETVDGQHMDIPGQVARAMSDKPLADLEEKVQSQHILYEELDSEPPEHIEEEKPVEEAGKTAFTPPEPPADDKPADDKPADDVAKTEEKPEEPPKEEKKDEQSLPDAANEARDQVQKALAGSTEPLEPKANLGSTDFGLDLGHGNQPASAPPPSTPPPASPPPTPSGEPQSNINIDDSGNLSFPTSLVPQTEGLPPDATDTKTTDAAPPPVPPPLMSP